MPTFLAPGATRVAHDPPSNCASVDPGEPLGTGGGEQPRVGLVYFQTGGGHNPLGGFGQPGGVEVAPLPRAPGRPR